jgi:hypothetical protein
VALRNITQRETLVYYVSPKGEYRIAPDSRVTARYLGLKGWHQFEAKTAREKEHVALKLSEQRFRQKKEMEVKRFLREEKQRQVMRASCKLRISQNFSPNDVEFNKAILRRMDETDAKMLRFFFSEFDPASRTTGLECELTESTVGLAANPIGKRIGVQV